MKASARLLVVAAAVLAAACEFNKTATPTSPDVAGPIAGVNITAPRAIEPAAGARVVTPQQVTLVVENATSNGARPISYTFEVSTESSFAAGTQVFAREGVAPGGGGRTSLTVGIALAAGRTYHWRSRALDGANTGPYSDTFHFQIVEPVVFQTPGPISPVNGVRVSTRTPTLRLANAARSGAPGRVEYEFQVSASDNFVAPIASGRVDEQGGETSFTLTDALPNNQTFYWRARAVEATAQSAWTSGQAFMTPVGTTAPPVPPPGTPPPAQGSGIPSASEGTAMIAWVIDDMKRRGINMQGHCGAWEITRRVAWQFRDRGAGLEYKPAGANCNENSVDILLFSNGQSVDILVGAGADNGPAWQLGGIVPLSWWIAPSNPDGGSQ